MVLTISLSRFLRLHPTSQLTAVLRWLALEHLEDRLRTAGADLQSIIIAGLGQLNHLTNDSATDATNDGDEDVNTPCGSGTVKMVEQLEEGHTETWVVPADEAPVLADDETSVGHTLASDDMPVTTLHTLASDNMPATALGSPPSSHGRAEGIHRAVLWQQIFAYFLKSLASERRQRWGLYFRLLVLLVLTIITLLMPQTSLDVGGGDGDDDAGSDSADSRAQLQSNAFPPLLFQFATYLWWPRFLSVLVVERAEGMAYMCRLMGLSATAYWTSVYVFQASLLYIVFSIFAGMGNAFGVATFTSASPALYVALFVLWAHAQIGMSVLLSAVFPSPRVSSIVMTLGCIICPIASLIINGVYDVYDTELFLFPPLAYGRAAAIILLTSPQRCCFIIDRVWFACISRVSIISKHSHPLIFTSLSLVHNRSAPLTGSPADKELGIALCMLFAMGSVCLVLGAYLHEVLPRKYGATAHPLFFLPRSVRRPISAAVAAAISPFVARDTNNSANAASLAAATTQASAGDDYVNADMAEENVAVTMDGFEMDDDVAEEERRVNAMSVEAATHSGTGGPSMAPSMAVIVQGLRKRFGSHLAVKGVTFGVEDGECFGLLGPNGAGKTTTINMLTGAMHADSGQAWIGGTVTTHCRPMLHCPSSST
jgi:hypothetical protein